MARMRSKGIVCLERSGEREASTGGLLTCRIRDVVLCGLGGSLEERAADCIREERESSVGCG